MGRTAGRAKLRLVERPQKEWMVDALDRAHAAISLNAGDSQTVRRSYLVKIWREAVVACGELAHLQFAVKLGQERAGGEIDADLLPVQRACQQRNNRCSAGAVFGVGGIIYGGQRTGMFYQNMLKATSRADERHASLAGGPDGGQHRLRIAIWAAGPDDDRRVRLDRCATIERVGGGDPHIKCDGQRFRGVRQRDQRSDVVRLRGC